MKHDIFTEQLSSATEGCGSSKAKRNSIFLLVVAIAFVFTGCAKSYVDIKFSDYGMFSGGNPGNKDFDEIGPVNGSAASWSFANCNKLVEKAITSMVDKTKALGGNAIHNVRFGEAGTKKEQEIRPYCKRRFGLLLFLVPMWADVKVNGIASKVESKTSNNAIIIDPTKNSSQIALEFLQTKSIEERLR